MSSEVKYCTKCAETKENVACIDEKNIEFVRGFLIGFREDITQCPYCGNTLTDVPITSDDFFVLREASNYNRKLLEAMIQLKEKDIIEYELKMSQFRNQVKDTTTNKEKDTGSNTPKCPTCGSSNIEKISLSSKVVGGALFGLFSSNVRKTMHCKNCGYKW